MEGFLKSINMKRRENFTSWPLLWTPLAFFFPSGGQWLEFVQDNSNNSFLRQWLLMLQNLSFSVFEWWRLDEVLGLQTSWKNSFCSQIQASSVSTGTPLSGGEPPCSPLQLTLSWTGLFCTEDRFCSTAKKRSLSLQEYCMKIQAVPAEEYSAGKKKPPPKKRYARRKHRSGAM